MKKIAKYLFSPFLKRIEDIHHEINENKSSIDRLSTVIEHIHNTLIVEMNNNRSSIDRLSIVIEHTHNMLLAEMNNKKTTFSQITDELIKLRGNIGTLQEINNDSISNINNSMNSISEFNNRFSEASLEAINEVSGTTSKTLHLIESSNIDVRAERIINTLNIISKRKSYNKQNPHILFLIHNMNTWYSVANVFFELSADPDLRVTIASIPRSFPGEEGYTGENLTSAALSKIGINHLRINSFSDKEISTILTTLSPDVIFRQSPWDHDIPPAFSASKINFAKLCYIPYYAINIVKNISSGTDFDFQSNQDLHNNSWRIYCDTKNAYEELCKNSLLHGVNARYFGHPKLDYIHNKMMQTIKHNNKKDITNILWAPHHSIDKEWLSFGTFDTNYLDFLRFAEENNDIHIRLRPHPALFDFMRAKSEEVKKDIEYFLSKWESLNNTSTDYDYDYIESFQWSDILITDGISFIVEYPLFHKPSIFIEHDGHAPFNELGLLAAECNHITSDFEGAIHLLTDFKNGILADKSREINELENIILPNKGIVHKVIAQDIKSNL